MSQMTADAARPAMTRERDQADIRTIPLLTLGRALSAFFIVSYIVCILGYLLLPDLPVQHQSLAIFLPGFTLLSWHTFFLGLIESFLWGWYIALVFGAIYNFFLRRAA